MTRSCKKAFGIHGTRLGSRPGTRLPSRAPVRAPPLIDLAREHRLVVSIEDNGRVGGCGATLLQALTDAGVRTPFQVHGIPQEFLDHAKRDVILARVGLDAQAIARSVTEAVTALPHEAVGPRAG